METYMNENETVVFEDFDLKIVKQYSDSETLSSISEIQTDVEYENCDSIFHAMKEHFLYSECGFFDRMTFSDVEEYLGNIDDYEFYEEIYFDNLGRSRKKPMTFHFWAMKYHDALKESYAYVERITKYKNVQNNTFYRFCLMGFNTSTSAISTNRQFHY